MMERNCGIFLAGDDALGYLAKPNHKIFQDIILGIHLVRADLMSNFSILPTSSLARMYFFRVPPSCAYAILSIWCTPLPFWLCSFARVSSNCFTSEIQKFMTSLVFFLSQTPTTSWHLIQFPLTCLGRPFH